METLLHIAPNAKPQRSLRIALWAMLLLAGHALQIVAATHWHDAPQAVADASTSTSSSNSPSPDLPGHDGCLLCQVAAQAGDNAPPPAPWILHVAHEARVRILDDTGSLAVAPFSSHAWQSRAPPRV